MKFQIAQINIARFRLPPDHPDNREFVDNVDRVNAIAEAAPGFVWRLIGDGNNALDVKAFDDPHIAVNLTVWTSLEALSDFVYRNPDHLDIMRRRKQWFGHLDLYMALWWVPEGHRPTLHESVAKLDLLGRNGPSAEAFTFRQPFPPPG